MTGRIFIKFNDFSYERRFVPFVRSTDPFACVYCAHTGGVQRPTIHCTGESVACRCWMECRVHTQGRSAHVRLAPTLHGCVADRVGGAGRYCAFVLGSEPASRTGVADLGQPWRSSVPDCPGITVCALSCLSSARAR